MERKEALEKTIKVWEYLRDHPEVVDKTEIPEELYNLIRHQKARCTLCTLYYPDEGELGIPCTDCPLYQSGNGCKEEGSPYLVWFNADLENTAMRRNAANRIVTACKEALKEEEK